jgi:putative ABC transport system permease protein
MSNFAAVRGRIPGMKFANLAWKNALRNKRRSLLTVLSLAASLFLLTTLQAVLYEFQFSSASPKSDLRVVVHHAVSFTQSLPIAYRPRIAQVAGVEDLSAFQWFGGIYIEEKNFFAQFAVEPEHFLNIMSEFSMPAEQKQNFIAQRTGAIAGKGLFERFHWKVGDRITLKGTVFPVDLEFVLTGMYTSPNPPDESGFYFHWDYLDEAAGRPGDAGTYSVLVKSREDVPKVVNAIDQMFRNSSAETKTETEKEFNLSFSGMLGNIKLLVAWISGVVTFTILLVTAATMGMSIRERTAEFGVLKSLGFTSGLIVALLVGESAFIALSGWLLGCVGARVLYSNINMAAMTAGFFPVLRVRPEILLEGLALALLVAILTAGVPAYRASKLNIAEALRYVG